MNDRTRCAAWLADISPEALEAADSLAVLLRRRPELAADLAALAPDLRAAIHRSDEDARALARLRALALHAALQGARADREGWARLTFETAAGGEWSRDEARVGLYLLWAIHHELGGGPEATLSALEEALRVLRGGHRVELRPEACDAGVAAVREMWGHNSDAAARTAIHAARRKLRTSGVPLDFEIGRVR